MVVESDARLESSEVDAPAILRFTFGFIASRGDLARPSRRLLSPCRRWRRASAATSVSSATAGDAQRTDARRASEVAGGARSRVHDGRSRAWAGPHSHRESHGHRRGASIQGLRSARRVLKSRERRAMRAFLAALALLSTFFLASPVAAALTEAELSDVGLHPVEGAAAPPDIAFTDDDGHAVALGDVTRGRATLLILADYNCHTICGPILAFAATAIRESRSRRRPRFQSCRRRHRPASDAGRRRSHEGGRNSAKIPLSRPLIFSMATRARSKDFPRRSATTRTMTPRCANSRTRPTCSS